MKKKKKKSISVFSLNPEQTFPLPNPTLRLLSNLISAPDVPKNFNCGGDLQSCCKFCEDLFGNCINEDDITLRIFVRQLAEKMVVSWNTAQIKDRLYIKVPLNASKESFIALLDYAEENLGVAEVIACIERQQQNCNSTVKAFQFMGFERIQPAIAGETYNVSSKAPFLCLGYDFEWWC